MMLSRDGGGCATYEKTCPQIPGGSGKLGRREGGGGWSFAPVQWWESGPGRECRLDHSPAASSISYTEVNGVSRESYLWTDWDRLSKTGARPRVPAKVIFFAMLFLSWILESGIFLVSPHRSVALGTRIFPAPQGERSLFLASGFMDGCREAVKCSWQINCEQGKRLLSFFLFSLIQLLSDLYPLNKYACPCFFQLWSWLVIAL